MSPRVEEQRICVAVHDDTLAVEGELSFIAPQSVAGDTPQRMAQLFSRYFETCPWKRATIGDSRVEGDPSGIFDRASAPIQL